MTQQRKTHLTPELPVTQPIPIAPGVSCGGADLWIVAGPCAVEGASQLETVTQVLKKHGVSSLRGGAFKPRTSPYSFQGMEEEGLELLNQMRQEHNMVIVTEVMSETQIDAVVKNADVLQVGSRNMQNFTLLKALGQTNKPVLLKRGLSATIDELLWAAEYIMAGGNNNVILCERGIRSYDSQTRNVLDIAAVPVLKRLTHLPVVIDPSHAAGRRDIIIDLARAAVAVGADGLLVEIHPNPEKSISDADQALTFDDFAQLMEEIKPVAKAVGRSVGQVRVRV